MVRIVFPPLRLPARNAVVLFAASGAKLGEQGTKLDRKLGGAVKRAMVEGRFNGAAERTVTILAPARSRFSRIVVVGLGDTAKLDESAWQRAGSAAIAALGGKDAEAAMIVDNFKGAGVFGNAAAANVAFGARLRSYRFDKYRTRMKPEQKSFLRTLTVMGADPAEAKRAYADLDSIANGVFLTRDLVSEPANVIYPETLTAQCNTLKKLGIKVEVLDEKQMKKLGMGALLGVAQGSANPPRLVSMSWLGDPGAKDKKPVVFVGKGVTFDSGGLSLKTAPGMEEMKWDMAGAGAVIGAMAALAGRKAKANVVGVVGLVENMPSGTAQRPGDVVTTMSGQTVEVLNTDAEGRLVLADALWYAQDKFNPKCVVDLATLTGAIIAALGHEYAGIFSNDDRLNEDLIDAGKKTGEQLWRFPLGDAYDKDIDSPIADMKNMGARGEAGSIAGAQFLLRFVKKGMPWAHLDIAGTAWSNKERPLCPKGATAFGVRLLDRFVAAHVESK